jgi:TolA-binding protein
MKRVFCSLLSASTLVLAASPATAQDSSPAAAAAERQDAEERYRRLNATLEELQATLEAQRKRIDELVGALKGVRDANARAANDAVTREELEEFVEKLREVDQKREADRKLILEEIAKLAKAPAPAPREKRAEADPPKGPAKTVAPAPKEETGYEHEVKERETLSEILAAYRRQKGLKITLKQVLDANPKLNPDRVRPGQKIFIPAPKDS